METKQLKIKPAAEEMNGLSKSALSNPVTCRICGDEVVGDGLGEGEYCEDCLHYDDLVEGWIEAAL